jgi:hypothetical protein
MCTLLVVLFDKLYVLEGTHSTGTRYTFMIGHWNTVTFNPLALEYSFKFQHTLYLKCK